MKLRLHVPQFHIILNWKMVNAIIHVQYVCSTMLQLKQNVTMFFTRHVYLNGVRLKSRVQYVEQIFNFFSKKKKHSITCSICLLSNYNIITKCGHVFQRRCLSKWVTINKSFPLCIFNFKF